MHKMRSPKEINEKMDELQIEFEKGKDNLTEYGYGFLDALRWINYERPAVSV